MIQQENNLRRIDNVFPLPTVNMNLLFCDASFIIAHSKLVRSANMFTQITFHRIIQVMNTVPQLKIVCLYLAKLLVL